MENPAVSKYTVSFGISLVAGSIVNALLVIVKEKSPGVQAAMRRFTGSHWITHVVIVLFVFLAGGCLLAGSNNGRGAAMTVNNLIRAIVGGMLVTSLIIAGFYLIAD